MKIIRLLLLLTSILFLTAALHAQSRPGNTELGIILGEPTGISAKFWQSGTTAIDAAAAWSFEGEESLHLHVSYLKHKPLDTQEGGLYLYYGLGARALFADDPRFGARIPVGLQYNIQNTRLSLFFEVAPTFDLIPETEFGVNGGLGVRYFL
jgi:hypothetical protein